MSGGSSSLVAVIIGLTAAGTTWFVRPKEYTADLTMYVSAQTADTTQSAYQGAQLVAGAGDVVRQARQRARG